MAIQNVTLYDPVTTQMYLIFLEYYAIVGSVLSMFGVVSNIINIRTFIIMGVNDGMTVCFLALSIFDLSYLSFTFSLAISTSFGLMELKTTKRFPIHPYAVSMYLGNFMTLLNVTNVLTTTFLAVARCMCVARPLHFKDSFTRKRTFCFVVCFAIFAFGIYSPIFSNMAIIPQFMKKDNMTRPTLWMSNQRQSIKVVIWMLLDMVLPLTTEFIVLVCVIVMATSLRASSAFRQTSMLVTEKSCEDQTGKNSKKKLKGASEKMADKDIRVVQQVVLISLVYAICNTPKSINSVVEAIVPEFHIGRRYSNLYLSVNSFRKEFEAFNAAINTVIYYRYNKKFRAKMCFCPKWK